jgi:hypothetical protein
MIDNSVWGPYPDYEAMARLEYGRRLWRDAAFRQRLLNHWTDLRHPWRDRFLAQRSLIEEVLASAESEEVLQERLLAQDTSLRCVAREIPPVFGSFWVSAVSAKAALERELSPAMISR